MVPGPTQVKVSYVTQETIYIGGGSVAGIEKGTNVNMMRDGVQVGTCTIDVVSKYSAICLRSGEEDIRQGDLGTFEPVQLRANPDTQKREVSNSLIQGDFTANRKKLLAKNFRKVEFQENRSEYLGATLNSARADLEHDSYLTFTEITRAYHHERMNMAVNVEGVGFEGLKVRAHVTTLGVPAQPQNTRFRTDARLQLYVRESALYYRPPQQSFSLAAGRFRPLRLPGVTILDGVLAGWRTANGKYEFGGYAGLVPEFSTLMFQSSRWTSGLYYSAGVESMGPVTLHHQGRIGLGSRSGGALYSEAEGEAFLSWAQSWRASLGTRLIFGMPDVGCCLLSGIRASLNGKIVDSLQLYANYRYGYSNLYPDDEIDPSLFSENQRASLGTRWSLGYNLELSLSGGLAHNVNQEMTRVFVIPELAIVDLLGSDSRLSIGHQQSFGWLSSWSIYTDLRAHLSDGMYTGTRISLLTGAYLDNLIRTIRVSSHFQTRIGSWFDVRASLGADVSLTGMGNDDQLKLPNMGIRAEVQLSGHL